MIKQLQKFIAVFILVMMPLTACADEIEFAKDTVIVKTKEGNDYLFNVELALSGAEKSRGLMKRKSLAKDAGMLFIFNKEEKLSFWMKNTLIPLDMIFIDQNGNITHIHSNARPLDKTLVTSPRKSLAVLEINGGLADEWGIKAGDSVLHESFRNILAE
jgi:uncharacterized membrane protein (UPF0127 family)